jgi:hypothetical protein
MAQNMGLGVLSNSTTIFKRKYRWTLSLQTPCGDIPDTIVKVASRPQIDIDDTEINYLHGKMWIPGKAAWQTLSVTFYDILEKGGDGSNDITNLYSWLSTVYAFNNSGLNQSSVKGNGGLTKNVSGDGGGYAGTATLNLYDGCGETLETWVLKHVWPQSINFGELDYASSDEATVDVTLRYSEATYNADAQDKPCMKAFTACKCVGCSGSR